MGAAVGTQLVSAHVRVHFITFVVVDVDDFHNPAVVLLLLLSTVRRSSLVGLGGLSIGRSLLLILFFFFHLLL